MFIKWLKYPTTTFTELKQGVDKDLKKNVLGKKEETRKKEKVGSRIRLWAKAQ